MRRIGVAVAVVLAGQPARADKVDKVVDKVEETIDDIRRLNRSIDMVVEVAYALSNPEELRLAPSRLYQTLLDDPVMAALVENIVNQYRGGYVQVAFDAGVTADLTTPGAVTASLDASYELPLCRVLGVTASGLGGYEDGEALATYAVGGTACLPLPANTLQVSYTRRDNVRTTLLAQPVVLRDRRTDDLVDIMIRGYRYLSKSNQIDVMPFDLGIDITRSAEDTGFGAQDVDLRVMPVAWYRKGKGLAGGNQSFRFFSVAAKFHQDDRSLGDRNGFVANISPLVVDGVHLAPDVTAGLDLGWSVSDAYDGDTKLIERTDVHTEAWVATSQKPLAA